MKKLCRDTRLLLLVAFRDLFGINRHRHTKDLKIKRRNRIMLGVFLFVYAMIASYLVALVYGLVSLQLADLVPAYLCTVLSLVLAVFGIFNLPHTLFDRAGYERLLPLPLSKHALLLSRLIMAYLKDLTITLAMFLPAFVFFAIVQAPQAPFYVFSLALLVFLPLIPLSAGMLFGSLVALFTAKSRHKTMIETVLMLLFVVVTFVLSFTLSESLPTMDALANLALTIGNTIKMLYPPAMWFGKAVLDAAWLPFIYYVTASLFPFLVLSSLLCLLFTRMAVSDGKKTARAALASTQSGLLAALYKRERKRYFSSSVYVTNTIVGPILTIIGAVSFFFIDPSTLLEELPFTVDPALLLPTFLTAALTLMPPSAVSLSMEGKGINLIRSLPIPSSCLFQAKILWTLTLTLPASLIANSLLWIILRPSPITALSTLLLSLSLTIFSAVMSILTNVKFVNFDWQSEVSVVKQSSAAFFGGFPTSLLAILCSALLLLLPSPLTAVIAAALLLGITALLCRKLSKIELVNV